MKLPAYEEPVAYGSLTKEQFDAEIEKGMEDIKAGRVYSADEVEEEMSQKRSEKYFHIHFRGTVSSRERCRTDRPNYGCYSKAGHHAE